MRVLMSQILAESSVITTKNTVTTAQNLQRTLAVQGRGRGEKKLHKCNFCSKPFTTEQGLKIHLARWCVSYLNKNILKTKKSQERLAQEILLHSQDPNQNNENYDTSTIITTASTSAVTSDTFALIPGTGTTVTETKETSELRRSARVPKPKIKLEQTDNVKKKRKKRRISKNKAVIKNPLCYSNPNQLLPVVPVNDLKRYKCKSCPRRFFFLEDCNFHETLHAGNYDSNFYQASVPFPVVQNINHQWVSQEKNRNRPKNNKPVPSISNPNYESVSMGNSFICKFCPSAYRNEKRLKSHIKWRHSRGKLPNRHRRQSEISNVNIRHGRSYSHNSGNGVPITATSDSNNPTVTTAEKALKPPLESSPIIPNPNPDHVVELIQPNGERRYSCKLCGEQLKSPYGAVTHGSIHHIGFRPFRCPICFKKFSRECSLKWHLTIHTGEKKFHCPVCQLPFRFPTGVGKHLKKHV